MTRLTAQEKTIVYGKLLQGAVYRSSLVSLFFSTSFAFYGFSSLATLQKFDANITLWSNLWPRLVFNTIPFLVLFYFFRRYKDFTRLKIWAWTLGFPSIFFSACLIHVWPVINAGNPDLYLYVHATNALVLVMAMTMVGPPPRFLIYIAVATLVLFVTPVSVMLYKLNQPFLVKFFLTDMGLSFFLGGLGSHMNYTLRRKLATEDVIHKRKVGKFLGNMVSESIFENDETLVRTRRKQAFMMSIDLRDFTRYAKSAVEAETSMFKERYHLLVSKIVGELGGFIHKTHGDGHLISLGLMETEIDLDDIPELRSDLEVAEKYRRQQQLAHAVYFFEKLVNQFEILKQELLIEQSICVCGAIDFGEVGLKMLGDPNVRLEFDVEGLVVIRCSRLENYTKTLRATLGSKNSFLVLSAEATRHLAPEFQFNQFLTQSHPLKDFPDETVVSYKEYRIFENLKKNAA